MTPKDPYEVLGVTKDASDDEIRKIYRQLALQYHPDRNPGSKDAEDKFREVTEAYATLSDPAKRLNYDSQAFRIHIRSTGRQAWPPDFRATWTHTNTRNPFIDDDSYMHSTDDAPISNAGEDITETLHVSLSEAAFGCQKKVFVQSPKFRFNCGNCAGTGAAPGTKRIPCMACGSKGRMPDYKVGVGPRLKVCSACRGAGFRPLSKCSVCKGTGKVPKHREVTVKIPAGINDGQRLRLAGCGTPGSPPGDLYVNVVVMPNDKFTRQGQDILTKIQISFVDAIRGCDVVVPTLEGRDIPVTIPPGAQQEAIIKVNGAGVTGASGLKQGDLLVQIHIEMPQHMTPRAELLLKELATELADKFNQSK